MKKILAIIGARPQFIKHAPLDLSLRGLFDVVTVHTGQHYDKKMNDVFFHDLGIQKPKYILTLGGGLHGEMTGKMLIELEPLLIKESPDAVLVYGDTNSTLAGALVASKLNIPVVHVESGLRSFNRSMPEEINRILIDKIASVLLVPSDSAIVHLKKEGITKGVFRTGDVMLDSIKMVINKLPVLKTIKPYILMTLHRPYNVDDVDRLKVILNAVNSIGLNIKFPVHPRTKKIIVEYNIAKQFENIEMIDPLGYIDNISFLVNSKGLITDSGGMQKEAYFLKKKCITVRSETEWTETLFGGWNTLLFTKEELSKIINIWNEKPVGYIKDLYGSGAAASQIAKLLKKEFD